MHKFHKKIRLDRNLYTEEGAISSITICTKDKLPYFQKNELAKSCIEQLKADTQLHNVPVYAYCFMPDHLHLIIAPSAEKDIVEFVGEYKGRTTRIGWKFDINGKLWQTSFYDHFIRKEETVKDVVMYVLNNPVRKGLVLEWKD